MTLKTGVMTDKKNCFASQKYTVFFKYSKIENQYFKCIIILHNIVLFLYF